MLIFWSLVLVPTLLGVWVLLWLVSESLMLRVQFPRQLSKFRVSTPNSVPNSLCHWSAWSQLLIGLKLNHLPFSLPTVHAKYTPGNQQCRSILQLRTSCAGVLHCRSWPTYFNYRSLPTYLKLLYFLIHSSSLIHPYVNLKTSEWSTAWVVLFLDSSLILLSVDGMHMLSVSA